MSAENLFDEVIELPDSDAQRQFQNLVGLDEMKELLLKEGRLLLNPSLLEEWSKKQHRSKLPCVDMFLDRPPLILFSGDVGTGKTTLANSFGDPIARTERIKVTVMRLSLMTRGRGAVGEMTQLISQAFKEVESQSGRGTGGKKPNAATILVIDEADALAASRAADQMHHEDRAGVNALIRGIDRLTHKRLPILIVLSTNRHEAMDPAVLRRAAAHHKFSRPSDVQRVALLRQAFGQLFTERELEKLADVTGPQAGRDYGYTYSDVMQRFIPTLVLDAFPDAAITFDRAMSVAHRIEPTRPFSIELRS
jgi:AAA+ superfamily predicted ATPase